MDSIVRKSLLIVDDHPIYRDALCEKISYEFIPEGIDVQAASGANEGLEILESPTAHREAETAKAHRG